MNKIISSENSNVLFERVVSILEQARSNVVRTVNSQMVIAYWMIGREIVDEEQQGESRAEYGKRLIEELSSRLTMLFSPQRLFKLQSARESIWSTLILTRSSPMEFAPAMRPKSLPPATSHQDCDIFHKNYLSF